MAPRRVYSVAAVAREQRRHAFIIVLRDIDWHCRCGSSKWTKQQSYEQALHDLARAGVARKTDLSGRREGLVPHDVASLRGLISDLGRKTMSRQRQGSWMVRRTGSGSIPDKDLLEIGYDCIQEASTIRHDVIGAEANSGSRCARCYSRLELTFPTKPFTYPCKANCLPLAISYRRLLVALRHRRKANNRLVEVLRGRSAVDNGLFTILSPAEERRHAYQKRYRVRQKMSRW